ncbi:hypothetical protein [Mycobacterium sp. IS-3022]|uniref:hypothetical protein n=1 Tax=Mycobacterium sp. IS-3022 TaxID=1772277 RepID=UPI000741573F|nr:hypothetical protein [Mycobacterium sp. IS-3022]KUH93945.1 hypothetical protein AU188_07960 [Mycobacterium sp. IS-3022]
MADKDAADREQNDYSEFAVDVRVRVNPDTDTEIHGVIVEDFGEMAAAAVDIGSNHFADPARRWAVISDEGNLLFADSDQLSPE